MTLLAAENVTVRRPASGKASRAIVDDVSFQAHAGELVAVIGANGAGKSTLLSVLAGLTRPDRGRVMLDARHLSALPRAGLARLRAYLPQNPRLEWPLPVERVVALGLMPRLPALGALPPALQPAIDRALDLCDLAGRRDQPATTLSGGEFTRAMLARAIVGDPAILIVDEPITGLDPRHAMETMALLGRIAGEGRLVIASVHDLTLAARHAGRFLALVDGRLAADAERLTETTIHSVFGVTAVPVGSGDSRGFTFLPTGK
jgi:iron complex transport system ATP-binding protein